MNTSGVYRMNGLRFFETYGLYGLRQLRRSVRFTAVATITLALGIGATTAIFSVVNHVLPRPLSYRDPGPLAWVTERFAASRGPGGVLGPDFVAWLRDSRGFQQIREYPAHIAQSRDRHVELVPSHELLVRNVRSLLLTLLGAVCVVFLIACANVANRSFSRPAARLCEFAIRGALDAGRMRLVRQLLWETSCWVRSGAGLDSFADSGAFGFLCALFLPASPMKSDRTRESSRSLSGLRSSQRLSLAWLLPWSLHAMGEFCGGLEE
jgi:hypothetical protein